MAAIVDQEAAEEGIRIKDREVRRVIDAAQPFAEKAIAAAPVHHDLRLTSGELRWALQRRLGLYVADALPTLEEANHYLGTTYDPLGDRLLNPARPS